MMAITLLRQPTEHQRFPSPTPQLEQRRSFFIDSPSRSLSHDASSNPTCTSGFPGPFNPRTLPPPIQSNHSSNSNNSIRLPGLAALASAASDAERNPSRGGLHPFPLQQPTERTSPTPQPAPQHQSKPQQHRPAANMNYATVSPGQAEAAPVGVFREPFTPGCSLSIIALSIKLLIRQRHATKNYSTPP